MRYRVVFQHDAAMSAPATEFVTADRYVRAGDGAADFYSGPPDNRLVASFVPVIVVAEDPETEEHAGISLPPDAWMGIFRAAYEAFAEGYPGPATLPPWDSQPADVQTRWRDVVTVVCGKIDGALIAQVSARVAEGSADRARVWQALWRDLRRRMTAEEHRVVTPLQIVDLMDQLLHTAEGFADERD